MCHDVAMSKPENPFYRKPSAAIPTASAKYVAHMEDVLETYKLPYDPLRPVVCQSGFCSLRQRTGGRPLSSSEENPAGDGSSQYPFYRSLY